MLLECATVSALTTRWPMTPVNSSGPVARHRKLCPVGSVKRSCTSAAGAPNNRQALELRENGLVQSSMACSKALS